MNEQGFLANPDMLSTISERDAGEILQNAINIFKGRTEPVLVNISHAKMVLFVGDVHGDFVVMRAVVKRFLAHEDCAIVFLGDIVDRAPADCRFGSVHSLLLALILKLRFPDDVFILRGNHEGNHVIPCYPHELHSETEARFGSTLVYRLFQDVFRMLPLMAQTSNGIFSAHAGIPKLKDWMKRGRDDIELSSYVTWGDPKGHGFNRGFGDRFDFSRRDLESFLGTLDAHVLVRGHGFTTLGTSIFDNRCLTIFTSRMYRNYGNKGILIASTHLKNDVNNVKDITIENLVDGKWVNYKVKELD